MDFYERYTQICADRGIDPCSQKAADLFGVTRATISTWNKKRSIPKGDTVKLIADALETSTDYLLCRTDDPTDYNREKSPVDAAKPDLEQDDSAKKTPAIKALANTTVIEKSKPRILQMYEMLDDEDQIKIEGVIQGLLLADKYKNHKQNLA